MLQYCPQSIAGGAVNVTAQRPQYRVLGHMARAKPEHPSHPIPQRFFLSIRENPPRDGGYLDIYGIKGIYLDKSKSLNF